VHMTARCMAHRQGLQGTGPTWCCRSQNSVMTEKMYEALVPSDTSTSMLACPRFSDLYAPTWKRHATPNCTYTGHSVSADHSVSAPIKSRHGRCE
jgi:hypothetical protein